MEVKTIYMDLVEWKKKDNVWKLESEAFKKPIKIEICYDDNDKKFFNDKIEEVNKTMKTHISLIDKLENQITDLDNETKAYENMLCRYEEVIKDYENKLEKKDETIESLMKEIATLKTTVETQSWAILHLQEQTKQIQQKLTKQPTVFHDKCFISGRENAWLWMYWIENGDYLMILNVKIWEHNEYVTNTDQLIVEEIHVDNELYVPFYKLEWGTELDLPTATIYYDLVFMPI